MPTSRVAEVYSANGKGPPVQPDIPVDGVCQDLDPDEPPPHPVANENTFYLNNGDGTFTTDIAGELGIADIWVAMQNVFGDYDNDGLRDLLSHNFLRSPLYRQVSGPDPMVFDDVSEQANLEICIIGGTGGAFVDLDNDGWLDTYGVEYEAGADSTALLSVMYLNNRDGTFTEITDEAGVGAPSNAMGIGFGDYDNDADQDLVQ
ncbi:MAG: VCBS repeat-containing protein, partial [Chloroflexi bacterium]|nr:VCBS repeat-containing protein [Chloroflexota bacterium]